MHTVIDRMRQCARFTGTMSNYVYGICEFALNQHPWVDNLFESDKTSIAKLLRFTKFYVSTTQQNLVYHYRLNLNQRFRNEFEMKRRKAFIGRLYIPVRGVMRRKTLISMSRRSPAEARFAIEEMFLRRLFRPDTAIDQQMHEQDAMEQLERRAMQPIE